MSEQARIIRRYVNFNYGDLITVSNPAYYENQRFWVAELKCDYPNVIRDNQNHESFEKYLTLTELGEIRLTDDNHIQATSRDEVIKRLESGLQHWRETAQEIILKTTSEELAPLGAFKDSIYPIVLAIRWLAKGDRNFITYESISKEPAPEKTMRWLRFLAQVKLLESTERGFTYSNLFVSLQKESEAKGGGVEEFVNHVVAFIMRDYYTTIRQVFRVSRFEPFLHMETCYYAPSMQAGRLLYRKEESLKALYHKWYSKTFTDYRLSSILDELEANKILEREGQYWHGKDAIWDKLKPEIATFPDVITPQSA